MEGPNLYFSYERLEEFMKNSLREKHREHQKENACWYRTLNLVGPGLVLCSTHQAF